MDSSLDVVGDAISVAILVHNEVLGRGIEAILDGVPDVKMVYRCGSPEEYAELLGIGGADCLVVAVPAAPWLAAGRPGRVIVLVDEASTAELVRYASIPADGYVSQQHLSAELLVDTLRRSRRGELPMPPALTQALLAQADDPGLGAHGCTVSLTVRETEALTLLVEGLSNKQIARRLAISSHGAKRLVASIMLKLHSPNRTTAAINAIRAGLVDAR
ncbi:response regulator transcription factor [Phytohabitans rumicis]|uniref:DNA-binding response regulator n=1 Tax=Phytohabitans rumicis TaxID=1076125 RepID=A0A6V8LH18_9ACTN|nr:response regulator transcription factor [Phytohabitans rumicis]GFJ96532.1 DNA-binding response regulator [Phytohabitans rumicis]